MTSAFGAHFETKFRCNSIYSNKIPNHHGPSELRVSCRAGTLLNYRGEGLERVGLALTHDQASLSPAEAMAILDERVKLIGKINSDIADWLFVINRLSGVRQTVTNLLVQERRRVEEVYAQALKKLASRRPQESSFELGYT